MKDDAQTGAMCSCCAAVVFMSLVMHESVDCSVGTIRLTIGFRRPLRGESERKSRQLPLDITKLCDNNRLDPYISVATSWS